MSKASMAILQMIIVYYVNCIEARHSIAYVLIPLSSETAMRLNLEPNGGEEIFLPCSNCFFKFDRRRNQLIQYYNQPSFGETPLPCGCFEFVKKIFTNTKEQTPITVSQNIIKIDVVAYYGVMKTDRCRLDSIKPARTVNGLQLALLMKCS